ncbi:MULTISPECIES: ornithine cyclodeaminase family protein [unclassified Duganella]|uniref:ornithine cyclodeaminase family protein n=1 Tax=unclassified Duganella TaxID=2636909 RepID=UPI0008918771|nr:MULTISPECIES: ornithine cyclodeaminase family protein [unclassified Duganella]SDF53851.1 ornithine cyclodeaminase [Duganella sp. OV458]SDI73608.1 ornithine cyclodeaminase [Duganella sp. OV510]
MRQQAQLLLLDRDAIAGLLNADLALDAVTTAFALHARQQGRIFPVVREALATGGVFGIKSGDVASRDLLGFKAAGFWPANRELGGEPHQATVMLFDPATGRPRTILDGNAITTARTAAAGELGLRTLARQDSQSVCVFGAGVQASAQLAAALRALPSLRAAYYVSRSGRPDGSFEARFAALGLAHCTLRHAADADAAVAASDVVITATPARGPLFSAGAVKPGTHINCVGADTRGKRELPDGVLQQAQVIVDDLAQASTLGEMQWAPGIACVQLGDLLNGSADYMRKPEDITVLDMTGLALQDLVLGEALYKAAHLAGAGLSIPWPW